MQKSFKPSTFGLFIIAACLSMDAASVATADPLRIGAILSLTGNNAAQGQYVRDGILLAMDEINKRGGLNGSKVDLVIADSKSDPKAAVDAFRAMEAAQHPLMYISYSTGAGTALAPIAEASHVALIGLVTTAIDFTKGRDWVFRYWPLGPAYITPLLHILQDLKVKNLGIVYQNDDFGKEQQKLMSAGFSATGGGTIAQAFELKDTDFQRQIAAVKDKEAIYIAGSGASLLNITRQLRAANYQGISSCRQVAPTRPYLGCLKCPESM